MEQKIFILAFSRKNREKSWILYYDDKYEEISHKSFFYVKDFFSDGLPNGIQNYRWFVTSKKHYDNLKGKMFYTTAYFEKDAKTFSDYHRFQEELVIADLLGERRVRNEE